jgi:hypothetical protein
MNTTKHLILGALSCLLLGVGFANVVHSSGAPFLVAGSKISPELLAHTTIPVPGGGGPSLSPTRTTIPVPGSGGPSFQLVQRV